MQASECREFSPVLIVNHVGWSICPSNLFTYGLCLNDTSWTDQPNQSTVLNIQKRYATVAYDVKNFSILSIESISNPVPTTPVFIAEAVGNLTHLFNLTFSAIPQTFNTSDPNFPTYASTWGDYWLLSWALRLYQDDYPNYPGGPLDVLKNFLTIPIQFSTIAWQQASWGTLPSDLNSTGTYATSSTRVLGKPWMLIAFTTGAGSLILFSILVLISVVILGPITPNSSRWPEIDTTARSKIPGMVSGGGGSDDVTTPDLYEFARQNGLGNGTSSTVKAYIQGQRVFVGDVNGAIVLAMSRERVGNLVAGQEYC
jgi:hypothetical protein